MDIVVHGTKGGRHIFTPKKLGGLVDVNSDASKASAIGQEAYAIRFVEKTIIFSKYKIIRDVRGDKRTGFIGFSLFLPYNKKLHGTDIISVLNKVSEEYCKEYIPENDNNLKDVRENWTFLDRNLEEFKAKLLPVSADDIENMPSGTKDDAYIYYKGDEELQKYFNAPYQPEYSQYRQVLFVNTELRDKPENPLNALRHSEYPKDNLTEKIDLKKQEYRLFEYNGQANNGVSIEIRINGRLLGNKDKITNKDNISIRYFKKHYIDKNIKEGRLNDESIRKYLTTNEESKKIDVEKYVELDPEIKTITFNIKNWKGDSVYDAKIICRYAGIEKTVENYNRIIFKGEDLVNRWRISAINDRFFSEERPIDFDKDCPGDTSSIDIVLNKHKLTIIAHEGSMDGDIIKNNISISKLEFIGNEIGRKHRITASCRGFKKSDFNYDPARDESPMHIVLQKDQYDSKTKTTHSYMVSAGEHGTLRGGYSYTSYDKNGRDVRHVIVPNEGYRFTEFKEVLGTGTLVAQYEKKKNIYQSPIFIAGLIGGAIVIGLAIWTSFSLLGKDHSDQPQQPDTEHIKAYIEGNSLILDTLNSYKETLDEGQTDVLNSLDSAIKKRELINDYNFPELKKLPYSKVQQNLKSVIEKIDSAQYDAVKNRLVNVSSLSLDQIADTIKAVLTPTKTTVVKKTEEGKKVQDEKNVGTENKETQPTQLEQKKVENPLPPSGKTAKTSEIIQYLKGNELKKEELNKHLKDAGSNAALVKSIKLCLRLWNLDGQRKNDYCSIYESCAKDNNLKETNLTKILKTLCDNKTSVNYAGLSNAIDILSKLKAKK